MNEMTNRAKRILLTLRSQCRAHRAPRVWRGQTLVIQADKRGDGRHWRYSVGTHAELRAVGSEAEVMAELVALLHSEP
jgi:hypothetical protein